MKNLEKYLDELAEHNDRYDIVCYWRTKIKKEEACRSIRCTQCGKKFLQWLNEEYEEKPKLTDDEKVILRNIKPDYKYIARDKDGDIYAYQIKPSKNNETWVDGRFHINIRAFNHLFQFIKWEDEEPYSIEELLKEEQK